MPSTCDHTSVGVLVERSGKLLLIERRKPPIGFAPPAGHVDSHRDANGEPDFEAAARAELFEEVGLKVLDLRLVAKGRKENTCRRIGGSWHDWKIYRAIASGDVKPSAAEVKAFVWCSRRQLRSLAERTRQFQAGNVSQADWTINPGLEPVWLDWLTEIGELT